MHDVHALQTWPYRSQRRYRDKHDGQCACVYLIIIITCFYYLDKIA
ncbi:hypothetical protein SXCC_01041 [Gluconacetobacter sp. SXCC-1]|nr:hypothetical protein SXCC_01041 [Gluconacetobacter sp. SXCC-1]